MLIFARPEGAGFGAEGGAKMTMKTRISAGLFAALLAAAALWAGPTPSPALLVVNKSDHTMAIVNPATLKVDAIIPVGNDPHEIVASPDGKFAYVSNYGFGRFHTITVVNLLAQKPVRVIDLWPLWGPHGLFYAGGKVYFTAEVNKVIGRYNPATGKVDWIMGTGQDRTHMIYVSKDLNQIYTSNVNSGTIAIFEKTAPRPGVLADSGPNWEETVIPTGLGTEGFDVSPDGKQLWAAAAKTGAISIIDLASKKVVQTLHANLLGANRVKFTPDGKYVFVSMLSTRSGGDLAIFNAATRHEVKLMTLGKGAAGMVMDPDGSRAFVSSSPSNFVAVIDLKTFKEIGQFSPGHGQDGITWAVRK
jgi:YVTN family beta-propeller protein